MKHLRRVALRFFDPEALVPFLIGSVAVGVIGGAACDLAKALVGSTPWRLAIIMFAALLVLAGAIFFLWLFARRVQTAPPTTIRGTRQPAKHRAVIALVSNEDVAFKAASFHMPALEHVWLIHSEQSRPQANKVKERIAAECSSVIVESLAVADPFDVLEVCSLVGRIYNLLPPGLEPHDVILDFTGLPSPASVGSVLACLNSGRAIQYTPGHYGPDGRARKPLDPVEVVLGWELLGTAGVKAPECGQNRE